MALKSVLKENLNKIIWDDKKKFKFKEYVCYWDGGHFDIEIK